MQNSAALSLQIQAFPKHGTAVICMCFAFHFSSEFRPCKRFAFHKGVALICMFFAHSSLDERFVYCNSNFLPKSLHDNAGR